MDQKSYLALSAPGKPGRREAEALVRAALEERGETPWGAMEIELFPGSGCSLIIARRRDRVRVYISLTALAFLLGGQGS